jgi:hypothetical protein
MMNDDEDGRLSDPSAYVSSRIRRLALSPPLLTIRRRPLPTISHPPPLPSIVATMSTDPAPPDPLKRAKRAPLIARNSLPHGSVQLVNKSLDSSLKRHLSLLNRLRKNFSLDSRDAVLKDVEGLTLTKYADELVDACLEGVVGLGGKGDVFVVAEVGSDLYVAVLHGAANRSDRLTAGFRSYVTDTLRSRDPARPVQLPHSSPHVASRPPHAS